MSDRSSTLTIFSGSLGATEPSMRIRRTRLSLPTHICTTAVALGTADGRMPRKCCAVTVPDAPPVIHVVNPLALGIDRLL